MKVRRSFRLQLALLLLVCAFIVPLYIGHAREAFAAVQCLSGYGSVFDGFDSSTNDPAGVSYEGVSATLINNTDVICDTGVQNNTNFNYDWVMIHQNNNAPGGALHGYAQIGFFRYWGESCAYFTYEYNQDANDNPATPHRISKGPCLTANTSNHYWVQFVSTDNGGAGDLRMNVDTTVMGYTPFNPWNAWNPGTYGPFWTEFNGETKYVGTNIPATNYSGMQVQQGENDAWSNALPGFFDACPWPNRYQKSAGVVNQYFAISTYGTEGTYHC